MLNTINDNRFTVIVASRQCGKTISSSIYLPREVEFTGWCRISEGELTWESNISWDELGCQWCFPVSNDLTWDDMKSATYEAMDRATFLSHYVGTTDTDESMMLYTYGDDTIDAEHWGIHSDHTGAYFWNNLDCTWNDLNHLWWDAMCITGDIPCYFEFGYCQSTYSHSICHWCRQYSGRCSRHNGT